MKVKVQDVFFYLWLATYDSLLNWLSNCQTAFLAVIHTYQSFSRQKNFLVGQSRYEYVSIIEPLQNFSIGETLAHSLFQQVSYRIQRLRRL
jgi:hypothetical protein